MGISMDEFGPVSLDYFNGQVVKEVVTDDDPDELLAGASWIIRFEGGAEIHNFSPNIPPPDTLVGKTQTLVALEAGVTRIYFGEPGNPRAVMMRLDPMEYAIKDESHTRGQLVYAQRSNVNMPPAAPPENVAEQVEDENA